jgi:hypothetical protein
MSELIERIRAKALREGTLSRADAPIRVWGGAWTPHPTVKVGYKSYDDPNRPSEVVCYATRPTVDLEDEVVLPMGLDFDSYFGKNRNIFVDHKYDILSAVAFARKVMKDSNGVLFYGQFFNNHENPYVKACKALAEAGTLATSVGMEAMDYGPVTAQEKVAYPKAASIIRTARVIELSYTALPMNGDARQIQEAEDKSRKAFSDAKIPTEVAEAFQIRRRVVVCMTSRA